MKGRPIIMPSKKEMMKKQEPFVSAGNTITKEKHNRR